MCHIDARAACRRGLVGIIIMLCFSPAIASVRAQETPTGGPTTIASSGEVVLLREQPGYDAAVLTTLGDGSALEVAGGAVTAASYHTSLPRPSRRCRQMFLVLFPSPCRSRLQRLRLHRRPRRPRHPIR
jgi:hypothetical protein